MSAPLPTLKSDAELRQLITEVCTNARQGQENLQTAIVQCVLHMKQHGNGNPLARLVNELPNSSRVDAVMKYVKHFTPTKFAQDKDVMGNPINQQDGRPMLKVKLRNKWVESDWQLEEMFSTTFYAWNKPNVKKEIELDLKNVLTQFIKKIDKALAKGGEPVAMDNLRMQRNLALAAEQVVNPRQLQPNF